MTLRAQIRDAVDDVAPATLDLEGNVRRYVLANDAERKTLRARRKRSAWVYRFQGAATLLAALLVVAVIAGLVFGGRFWRDLNSTPSTINQTELKSLEQRPLNFPTVAPGAPCPETPQILNHDLGMVTGGGPVYVVNGSYFESTAWGGWAQLEFLSQGTTPGLVLIRARDLQGNGEFVFAQFPLAPSSITAVGRVLGQEHAVNHDLQLRAEAVFHDPWTGRSGHMPQLLALIGLQKGASGCTGFQFDGPDFHENFVMNLPMVAHGTN